MGEMLEVKVREVGSREVVGVLWVSKRRGFKGDLRGGERSEGEDGWGFDEVENDGFSK